jgi:hypothetical protein
MSKLTLFWLFVFGLVGLMVLSNQSPGEKTPVTPIPIPTVVTPETGMPVVTNYPRKPSRDPNMPGYHQYQPVDGVNRWVWYPTHNGTSSRKQEVEQGNCSGSSCAVSSTPNGTNPKTTTYQTNRWGRRWWNR